MNGCNVLVTIVSVLLMDHAGRRVLLLGSVAAMALSGALLTFTLDHADQPWVPVLCVVSIVGFVGAFGIGLGPVACLLPSELFPAAQRASGSGFAFSVLWITQFATTFVFLLQVPNLDTKAPPLPHPNPWPRRGKRPPPPTRSRHSPGLGFSRPHTLTTLLILYP